MQITVYSTLNLILFLANPPRITAHPEEVQDAVPGQPVTFTTQATGTKPLSYRWQFKPIEEDDGNDAWQICECDGTSLNISSVQKSNEGSYRCVVMNSVGMQDSKPVKLSVGKIEIRFNKRCTNFHSSVFLHAAEPPIITSNPQEVKDAVPGKPVTFTIQATGTEPLNYHWELRTEGGSGEWQSCDEEGFIGANSLTLTIPRVQMSNKGSYHCTVSNCAGSETSECTTLTVG